MWNCIFHIQEDGMDERRSGDGEDSNVTTMCCHPPTALSLQVSKFQMRNNNMEKPSTFRQKIFGCVKKKKKKKTMKSAWITRHWCLATQVNCVSAEYVCCACLSVALRSTECYAVHAFQNKYFATNLMPLRLPRVYIPNTMYDCPYKKIPFISK